jgi:autotransporter-associated beta strand protein
MKQETLFFRSLLNTVRMASCAVTTYVRTYAFTLIAFALSQSAYSIVTLESYWPLGEGTTVGGDSFSINDGETNNFNNINGTTVLTSSPAGAAGSTAYANTSGSNFQGLYMFGAGSDNQTIPTDNWGMQFQVRSTATIASGFRAVFGMAEGVSGGLVIEANTVSGTTYWDVNRQGVANYIIPRNATTTVTLNTWTDLALVKSGGTISFYVNGVLAGSNAGAANTSGLFAFGLQQNVGTNGFQGDFDEARFFTFNPGAFTTADLNRLTVNYNGNGNTGGTEPVDSGSYYSSTSVTVLGSGTLTKTSSVFIGWNTLADGTGTSYSPAATLSIGNADTTLYAQWATATATIAVASNFPSAITTIYGAASGPTSTTVSGTNLSGDITATAPSNLEVSNDNITFGSTTTFSQSGGNASGPLYVRIKNNAPASDYNAQSVVLTSTGATPVNIATTASGNTVTPKNLTIPSAAAQDKMQDGTTAGIVIGTLQTAEAFGDGTSGDGIPFIGDTLTVSAPGTFSSALMGGPYTVTAGTFTLGGSSAGNYTLTQPTSFTLSAYILNTATWTQLSGGSWTNNANWLNNVAGTGADNTADFSTLDITTTTTVTLPSSQTIGGLIFGDTAPSNNWIISGSTLTLAATTTPTINISDQTTTISSILASVNGMSKTGAGTLVLSSNTSGLMNITTNEGTLRLAVEGLAFDNDGGVGNKGNLNVNSGAVLRIAGAYNIGYNQVVNINDGTLDIANNSTGDGANYTLNLNFTNGGFITSSTNSSLRWGELADASITVNGTVPATITSILRMIPGNSRSGTINVVDAAGNLDFFGNIIDYPGIPGGVPLIKTGAGTLTLAGANNYTSSTTVNAGTLAVTGTLIASAITVAANATLDAGSNLSGKAALGASLNIDSAGHLAIHIENDPTFQVTRTISGALTLNSGNLVDLTAAVEPIDGIYTLVTAASISGTPGTGTTLSLASGRTATLTVSGSSLILTITSGGYDTWKTQITNGKILRTEDADDDGATNLQEFLFGTNPMVNTGSLTISSTSGGILTIRWKQRISGSSYLLRESATLDNPWIVSGTVPINDGPVDGDYQPRKAEINMSGVKNFFRIEGIEN